MLHSVYQLNTRRWGSNPVHDAIFNQLLYGWGVLRTTWSRNTYADNDEEFQGDRPMYHFPIEIKNLPFHLGCNKNQFYPQMFYLRIEAEIQRLHHPYV